VTNGLVVPDHLKDDPEVQALLAELDAIFEQNPLEGYNHPSLPKRHVKQLEFHAHVCPPLGTKLLLASNRSGKTVAGVVDDVIQLVPDELIPSHLQQYKKWHEAVKIWVGAPKNENHYNNTIPLFRKFLPKAALVQGKWSKSFKSQPNPRIELASGSEVAFKTYDQDLDAWAGAEIHRIHWDEEPNGANADELRREARYRLVSTAGDELVTMTPVLGAYSWVNDKVWARRDHDPQVFAMKMKIWDNPWNGRKVVEQIVKEAKEEGEESYRTRIEAEFVHLGGLFFPEFSESHVVDEIEPSFLRGQEVVVSIDPGRRRSGVTWTAFDKDNDALVFDEFFPAELVVPEVATEIKTRNKYWGLKEEDITYVIDPSSRNRSQINADQVEAAYIREGIYPEHAQNSRPAGILEVRRRLQSGGLQFTKKCPQSIKQMGDYARDPKAKDEWQAVPQTDKVRFDLVDTVRYAVMSRTYYSPEESPYKAPAFQPNFQPPYREERFQEPVPPMGPYT